MKSRDINLKYQNNVCAHENFHAHFIKNSSH